jgi:hypothetical protein
MQWNFKTLPLFFIISCCFILSLFLDQLGFKFFSISIMILTALSIVILPTKISLFLALIFISFQGFLKVISNYHPVVHLGADIVIITLVLKLLFQMATKNFAIKAKAPPFTFLFVMHFCWLFVVCFNPYSLSFISSIAGSKIYISMFFLYFFGYYLVNNKKDVHNFFILFIVLTIIHNVFAIYQGFMGPSSVTSIHPRYAIQLQKYLTTAFRPFGLTNLPGGPSVYIYSTLPFFAYFIYIGKNILMSAFLFAWLPISGLTLMFCQVRSALLKGIISLVIFFITLLSSQLKISYMSRLKYVLGSALALMLIVYSLPQFMDLSVDVNSENEKAFERSLSSFDIETISHSRRNALERFILYFKTVPLGAGFSRVGASAGAFSDLNKADKHFPQGFFFADNLFITLLIEIGLPGLMILSLLIFLIIGKGILLWRNEKRQEVIPIQLAILSALIAISLGSLGAEGIIYNPESCFFWLFAGILMRTENQSFNKVNL